MATTTLSLPEARSQVSAIGRNFTALVAPVIDQTIRGIFPQPTDEIYLKAIDLLRAADRLIFSLLEEQHDPDSEWANVRVVAQALRAAIYLNIIHFKPDQASYWSEETQARVRPSDHALTPEIRAMILSDSREAYRGVKDRPEEWAVLTTEDRLWDTVVGDGLDDL